MTDIIVAGYPKSGTTWVARLVAELVECPVVGFWGSDHIDIAQEGLHRKSEYQCFKSHHQFHELYDIKTGAPKIIYVARDPRDIAISGARHFHIERWPFVERFVRALPRGQSVYNRLVRPLISSSGYRIKRMIHAVLYGSREIHWWLRIPWASHYRPYMDNQCFFVKYEDLLSAPERECEHIITFLGLDRNEHQIKKAIERQSFENKKNEFLKNNELTKANFMRIGKKEQWKKVLSKKQKKTFNKMLADELRSLGYHVCDGF